MPRNHQQNVPAKRQQHNGHRRNSSNHRHNTCCPSRQQRRRSSSQTDDLLTKATSSHSHHTADLLTPPPSPLTTPQLLDEDDDSGAFGRLAAAKRQGQLKALMQEYALIKQQQQHTMSEPCYGLVIEAHASLRREGSPLTSMLQVYDDMSEASVQASAATFSTMVQALCKRDGEAQKTVATLKRQVARALEFDNTKEMVSELEHDLAQLEQERNHRKAFELFCTALATHGAAALAPDMFSALLRVLSHHDDTDAAQFVYRHVPDEQRDTSHTYQALIVTFGRAGDLASALSAFEEYKAKASGNGNNRSCAFVHGAMVDAYLRCDEVDAALAVMDGGVQANAVVRHYCCQGRLDKAKVLAQSIEHPDASTYGPLVSAYCHQGDLEQATAMYEALIKHDLSKAYGNLANYAVLCLKRGLGDRAFQVVHDMHAAHLEPDAVLAEQLILCFVKEQRWDRALEALQHVVGSMAARSLNKAAPRLAALAAEAMAGAEHPAWSVVAAVVHGLTSSTGVALTRGLAAPLMTSYQRSMPSLVSLKEFHVLCEAALLMLADDDDKFSEWIVALVHRQQADGHLKNVNGDLSARVLLHLSGEASKVWQAACCDLSRRILRAVTRGDPAGTVMQLVDEMADVQQVPTAEPIRDAIALAGKQGQLGLAQHIYDLCAAAFKRQCDHELCERGLYLATNSLLIGYAQQGDMAQAKQCYDRIKRMGRYPDSNAYASLLVGTAKHATTVDEATDALTIYEEAKRHNVKPTTFFYNVVISKLAKARKLETTLRLFDEMQHLFGLSPNIITYGAVISAAVRAGSESHACSFFDAMVQQRGQLRIGPFNNMIQFYVRQQPSRDRALFYFEQLRKHRVQPSAHTYKLLIEAYAMLAPHRMDIAHQLLTDMLSNDRIRPQPTHYATLIYAYGTVLKDVARAQDVFQQVIDSGIGNDDKEGLEAVYQAMLDTFITNDHLDRAEQLYAQMSRRISKSASPYIENLLLRGYGQKGLLHKAEQLFDSMADSRPEGRRGSGIVVREPSTYEAMVRAYVDNGMVGKARSVLDRMIRRQFPDKVVAAVSALILSP